MPCRRGTASVVHTVLRPVSLKALQFPHHEESRCGRKGYADGCAIGDSSRPEGGTNSFADGLAGFQSADSSFTDVANWSRYPTTVSPL